LATEPSRGSRRLIEVSPADAGHPVSLLAEAILPPLLGEYGVRGLAVLHSAVELHDEDSGQQEVDSADQLAVAVEDLHLEIRLRKLVVVHQYPQP
jgi:hypothetical protein